MGIVIKAIKEAIEAERVKGSGAPTPKATKKSTPAPVVVEEEDVAEDDDTPPFDVDDDLDVEKAKRASLTINLTTYNEIDEYIKINIPILINIPSKHIANINALTNKKILIIILNIFFKIPPILIFQNHKNVLHSTNHYCTFLFLLLLDFHLYQLPILLFLH